LKEVRAVEHRLLAFEADQTGDKLHELLLPLVVQPGEPTGGRTLCDARVACGEPNRQSSARLACSEKIAKLTPPPSHVAPSG